MCKKAVPKEDPPIEIETTNVGFVNMSESAVSTIGIREIISTIILVMISGMIVRYCCKWISKSRAANKRNLEETMQAAISGVSTRQHAGMHVNGPSAPMFAAQQPPAGIPMVTFENPGQRRVHYSAQPASHWEMCK